MGFTKDLKNLLNVHYILNIILCISFVFLRTVYPFCSWIFADKICKLAWRDWEILTFVSIVIVFKTRRSGATTMLAYLSAAFMYCKIGNVILYMNSDPRLGVLYIVLCILQMLLFPEPSYSGPEHVIYFRGPHFKDELNRDKKVAWLVAFYAAWSPACVKFAPIFAELSAEYSLDNFKFGKVDVAQYPQIAKDYYINDSSFSKQLPTLLLFRNGKEVERRPLVDDKSRLQPFFFTSDNIKATFDLNNVYLECKNKVKKSDLSKTHHKSE